MFGQSDSSFSALLGVEGPVASPESEEAAE
jgi:hypothetical protein